ncbi:hypothetical protein CsSME_00037445 [Camellia sinensis var. sinensis]|uniref:Uncharacterized protein n=1 Tax=Camellia sinensis var. sinensis TaxID=542762 RepID=A0A4S4ERT6_CAMSN|nr:hypothetical protein TEA_007509 [Camellia sinensis var. sinensis]
MGEVKGGHEYWVVDWRLEQVSTAVGMTKIRNRVVAPAKCSGGEGGGIDERGFVDSVKETMSKEIVGKLKINQLLSHSPNSFLVADFGCSTRPNTFAIVQIIQEAIELKFKSQGLDSLIPEFQFLFNDLVSNDFNTRFTSLPPKR